MRILSQIIMLLVLFQGTIQANDPLDDKKSNVANRVLIVAGGQNYAPQAFASIKRNHKELTFETISYPVHEKFGAGNNVTIDLSDLSNYGYVFISIDQGTLSENNLQEIAEYLKQGGKVFMLYDSNQRDCFTESMANNANKLLSILKIRDEIKFQKVDFDPFSNGSILAIDDQTRKQFTTQKSMKWMKNQGNATYSSYTATMKSGHCFYKGSDLSASSLILEFNNQSGKYHTGAFWRTGAGVLGIGTERMTSGEAPRNSFKAGDIVWDALNLDNPSPELKKLMSKPAELKFIKHNRSKRKRKSKK